MITQQNYRTASCLVKICYLKNNICTQSTIPSSRLKKSAMAKCNSILLVADAIINCWPTIAKITKTLPINPVSVTTVNIGQKIITYNVVFYSKSRAKTYTTRFRQLLEGMYIFEEGVKTRERC